MTAQICQDDLPKGRDIVIVGAGAYGLSAAWFLSQAIGGEHVLVLDSSDFAGNGTGRCIGGFRTQWGHESNIRMSMESVRFFEKAAEILDYPEGIDIKQKGYLLLAWDEATMDRFRGIQDIQHQLGVQSQLLTPDDVAKLSPPVNQDGLRGAAFCERDGTISPFRLLDALLTAVRREGADVRYGTQVRSLHNKGRGFIVQTTSGDVRAKQVLVCTDWAAPVLMKTLGIQLPVEMLPVEIMVSEPTKPLLGPVHISMKHDMAINQMVRGSVVINHGRPRPRQENIAVRPDWIRHAARGAQEVSRALADLNILRAWAGMISITPDMQPILDEMEIPGLYTAVSAYKGLMNSPAAGRYMADLMLGRAKEDPLTPFVSLSRLKSGNLVREPMTNGARLDD
ncbi:FAD-binding oxidoreductase [Mesorhizobium sp.]|uniref:NAD(P)/FAD-dependent oxidoreductase n=1 Tax=Mesorhizobium sp. TaxID=1871066 RepID=UPI0025BDC857|nr:FAD-binding oxidoreductase [Mesorhizobium sp.]